MTDLQTAVSEQMAAGAPSGRRVPPRWQRQVLIYGAAFVASLIVGSVVFLAIGANPIDAYRTMLRASVGSGPALALTLNKSTPLLLGGVAVAFALRAGYINLGVDGQIYLGATFATGAAFALAGAPAAVIIPAAIVAGALGGFVLGLLAGMLRAIWGVNELFVTVMLSFVAFYVVEWVTTGPWQDRLTGEAVSVPIPTEARLPTLFANAHVGVLGAVLIAAICAHWLATSRRGFEFRAAGINPLASQYAGISLVTTGIIALSVAGTVGGLAGAVEVLGVHRRLTTGISPDYGLMAVLIAVLARNRPLLVVPVSFAFGVLIVGSDALQGSIGLPAAAVLLFQALVVLSVIYFEARGPGGGVLRRLRWRSR
jgi:general nucleoside transport system permease protein